MAGPPYPVPNQNAPVGNCGVDPVTGAQGAIDLASYAVQTAGTNTLTTGRSSPGGVFEGIVCISGTAPVIQAFDVVVSGTTTTTNALTALTTASAGQVIQAAPAGIGVRFLGSLVVVITGTSVNNVLWD